MKRGSSVEEVLQPLSTHPYQVYLSNELQVADVLEWILEQVGRAEVWQTSFSISEEFLRRLFFIERKGKVSRFNLVLDHKAINKTLKLWVFIRQVIANTFLADNHSKILLLQAESGEKVTVVTSQNLTRGNRMESALVTTDPSLFDELHKAVLDLIRNHAVPLNDLFNNLSCNTPKNS